MIQHRIMIVHNILIKKSGENLRIYNSQISHQQESFNFRDRATHLLHVNTFHHHLSCLKVHEPRIK